MMGLLSWGTPFYLLAVYGMVRYFSKPDKEAKENQINWHPLETVGVTVAIYFVSQLIGGALVYLYPLARHWNQNQINNWINSSVIAEFLLVLAVETLTVWLLVRFLKHRKATVGTIGLQRRPQWTDLAYVLMGFVIYFILYIAIVDLAKALVPHLDLNQQQQLGFKDAHRLQLLPVFVSLVLLPPFVEELLVRGFLYSGLKKSLPKIWAVLLTSALFATAHLQAGSGAPLLWVAALDTFVLSLVLIYLREKTGSLWASIGLHMLKNTIAFLSLFVFHVL
ncbi:MAG TPA: type II CAAX endopeptidase family protein [Patescibacteria group bacterium]|nr:type II CAAX endopeptidase family protein [Patescibacteria group bacterium]